MKAETLRYFLLISAHAKFLTAFEHYDMVTVKPRMHFFHVLQVNDSGPVNSDEFARVEPAFKTSESFADIVLPRMYMKPGVVAAGFDPFDISCLHKDNAAVLRHGQPIKMIPLQRNAFHRFEKALDIYVIGP